MIGMILAPIIVWFSLHTELPVPDYMPEIKMVSDERLWNIYMPGIPFPENPDDGRVLGLYSADVVYISEDCPLSDAFCVSILVHEMVHHYQDHSDREYACLGEREEEAYRIQQLWLKHRGIDIWEHIDPMWTIMTWQLGCGYSAEPR